jgi:hypothetical protein
MKRAGAAFGSAGPVRAGEAGPERQSSVEKGTLILAERADAPNAAMTSLFQGRHHWRGIGVIRIVRQHKAYVREPFGHETVQLTCRGSAGMHSR